MSDLLVYVIEIVSEHFIVKYSFMSACICLLRLSSHIFLAQNDVYLDILSYSSYLMCYTSSFVSEQEFLVTLASLENNLFRFLYFPLVFSLPLSFSILIVLLAYVLVGNGRSGDNYGCDKTILCLIFLFYNFQ